MNIFARLRGVAVSEHRKTFHEEKNHTLFIDWFIDFHFIHVFLCWRSGYYFDSSAC